MTSSHSGVQLKQRDTCIGTASNAVQGIPGGPGEPQSNSSGCSTTATYCFVLRALPSGLTTTSSGLSVRCGMEYHPNRTCCTCCTRACMQPDSFTHAAAGPQTHVCNSVRNMPPCIAAMHAAAQQRQKNNTTGCICSRVQEQMSLAM